MSLGFGAGASRRQDCSRARCWASSCAWCSCSFSARAWRVARRWGSGAATTPIRFQETLRPSPGWNTLTGSISISKPVPLSMGESQKVVLLNLSVSASKTSAHPSSTLSSPCSFFVVFATAQHNPRRRCCAGTSISRTSHLRLLGMSATLSVWVRRISSTSSRVCCDFSSYRLYLATSPERRSRSSARRRCSSSYCRCSASSQAQTRRRQSSAFAESRICWRRFSRFLVESVEIARSCAISGTSSRRKVEVSMPITWHLLALQIYETEAEAGRRVPGSGAFGCNCVGR